MTNELARTLAAHPAFKWAPGMAALDKHGTHWRIYAGSDGILRGQGEPAGYIGGWESTAEVLGAVPDLDDLATVGALLPRVDEAATEKWGRGSLVASLHRMGDRGGAAADRGQPEAWCCSIVADDGSAWAYGSYYGPTRGSAAASALLACLPTPTEAK